jgi:hypothetical protein
MQVNSLSVWNYFKLYVEGTAVVAHNHMALGKRVKREHNFKVYGFENYTQI